jgi:hypothetical protein
MSPSMCAVIHRAVHAGEPLVAFGFADGEGHVPAAQARVAVPFDVELRPAEPAGEELVQLLPRAGQVIGMQRADRGERFVILIHVVVEGIDELTHALIAAERIVWRVVRTEERYGHGAYCSHVRGGIK